MEFGPTIRTHLLSQVLVFILALSAWVAPATVAIARTSANCAALLESGEEGSSLRSRLHDYVKQNHQSVTKASYRELLYQNLQPRAARAVQILDVYCNEVYEVPGHYSKMYPAVNVEHTWPQSRFSKRHNKALQKTDLHHLFLTNTGVNNSRGNYEFGVVARPIKGLDCEGPKLGYDQNGQLVFEPPDTHKGAVARAIFYFALRYEMPISANQKAVLQQWNRQFPVSASEKLRNQNIEKLQGNRNPFIDDPELVDTIWVH